MTDAIEKTPIHRNRTFTIKRAGGLAKSEASGRFVSVSSDSAGATKEMAQAVTETLLTLVERIELQSQDVAHVLGVSASYISKLRKTGAALNYGSHPYQNAVMLLRTLDAAHGMLGTEDNVQIFMMTPHDTLGDVPIKMMAMPEGLVDVTRYVESFVH